MINRLFRIRSSSEACLSAIAAIIFLLLTCSHVRAHEIATFDELLSRSDSELCRECHDDIDESLRSSSHVNSLTPSLIGMLKTSGEKLTPDAFNAMIRECLTCHAPASRYASEDLIGRIGDMINVAADARESLTTEDAIRDLSKMQIDCRICHMMLAMPERQRKEDVVYGPGWDEHEHSHRETYGFDTLKSEYLLSSSFCIRCHRGCDDRLEVYGCTAFHISCRRYDSSNRDRTCQSCHMKSGHAF